MPTLRSQHLCRCVTELTAAPAGTGADNAVLLAPDKIASLSLVFSKAPVHILRVQPTGMRSYYARLGHNYRIALGKVGVLQPEETREKCQIVLGNVANGRHPLHGARAIHR